MTRTQLKILFIALSLATHDVSADQKGLNLEPLALANTRCAAFYTAAQVLIKPEAKKGYESKFSIHYVLSHQLGSSHETLTENLNAEIQHNVTDTLSFKEKTQVVDFLTKNQIKCSAIETQSTAIIQNNTAFQK